MINLFLKKNAENNRLLSFLKRTAALFVFATLLVTSTGCMAQVEEISTVETAQSTQESAEPETLSQETETGTEPESASEEIAEAVKTDFRFFGEFKNSAVDAWEFVRIIFEDVTDEKMSEEEKLENCYYYIASMEDLPYELNNILHYPGNDWPEVYINDMILTGARDGYAMAASLAYCAVLAGYENVYACQNGKHAWVDIDGLVYDTFFTEWKTGSVAVFGVTYEEAMEMTWDVAYEDYSGEDSWRHIKIEELKPERAGTTFLREDFYYTQTDIKKPDGRTIVGEMYLPFEPNGKTVILCHGLGGNRRPQHEYAEFFAKNGFNCYLFDFCGGSENCESDGAVLEMSAWTEVDDIKTVHDALALDERIDPAKIYLCGFSMGAFVSALYAAEYPEDAAGMVLMSAAFTMPSLVRAQFEEYSDITDDFYLANNPLWHLGRPFAEAVYDMQVYEAIKGYDGPVLLLHGTDDISVPYECAEDAVSSYEDVRLILYEGGDHIFSVESQKEQSFSDILEFMSEI